MFDYKKYDYPLSYDNVDVITEKDKDGNEIHWNNLELIKDIFTFQCSVGCRWGDVHRMTV
jgi:hypothetical protein